MQVLWSRAAQASSSCSCRSCLHTATNIARRTTTTVGKRRVKINDVFTACYSTILATAAVADMRVKEERRKEWDRVIAEAKAETPANEPDSGRTAQTDGAESNPKITSLSTWKMTGRHKNNYNPLTSRAPGGYSTLDAKLLTVESQLDVESSLVKEEPDPELPARDPTKPIHIIKMQGMVGRLVRQFLHWSNILTDDPLQGNPDIRLQTIEMKDRLQSLLDGFHTLPLYEWKDDNVVYDQRDALHRSLHALCRKTNPDDEQAINLLLAKISYNMLVCTSPPSMVTYNVLLAEFTRLGQPWLGQMVVNSFLLDSKFKPSRITVKLILDHYRSKKDPRGFYSVIMRMRSVWKGPDGMPCMRIRKRHVRDLFKPQVQEWALHRKTIHRRGALYEKVPRDAAIFDSVIKGCLELHNVRAAVRNTRAAFLEGCTVHHETLCSVIRACVDQADFGGGISLLRHILSLWESAAGEVATVYTEELRQLLYQLLVMCGFDTSLGAKKDLPIVASWKAFQDLLHFMYLESLSEALDRFADLTASLTHSLSLTWSLEGENMDPIRTPEVEQTLDVDLSLQLIQEHVTERQLRAHHQKSLEASSRWNRLEIIEIFMDTQHASHKAILNLQSELTALAYNQLSDDQKAKYDATFTATDTCPPTVAFITRHRQLLRLREPVLSISKQEAAVQELSVLPKAEQSIPRKEVAWSSIEDASSRAPIDLPTRPHLSPSRIAIALEAMRDKTELDPAVS